MDNWKNKTSVSSTGRPHDFFVDNPTEQTSTPDKLRDKTKQFTVGFALFGHSDAVTRWLVFYGLDF